MRQRGLQHRAKRRSSHRAEGAGARGRPEQDDVQGLGGAERIRRRGGVNDDEVLLAHALTQVGHYGGQVVGGAAGCRRNGDDGSVARDDHAVRTKERQLANGLSVGVEITGDVDGALEKAVGSCLSDRGIAVSRSSGARYVFTGGLTTSTSDGPRVNVYVDYEVDLEIVDRQSGRTVSRIRLSGREGHRNVSQAMSRVIATLETGLVQELDKVFSGQ